MVQIQSKTKKKKSKRLKKPALGNIPKHGNLSTAVLFSHRH